MATTTVASAPIRSAVPRIRILRVVNPLVAAILRSPFHRVLSKSALLLTYTGRRSGTPFTIPVGYTREGDTVLVFSAHSWWKSLRGGAPVTLRLEGHPRAARADLIEDPEAVLAEIQRYLTRYGVREAGRRIGLSLDPGASPSRDELARAMSGRAMIRLTLDPVPQDEPATTRAALARWRTVAIFAVKLVHSAIFLSIAASVLYVFYAGLANRTSRLSKVALGAALTESLIFTVNRFHCPLRALAEDLGAESGQVTDIFLPRWFADRIPYFFTPPLLIGVAAMRWNRRVGGRVTRVEKRLVIRGGTPRGKR